MIFSASMGLYFLIFSINLNWIGIRLVLGSISIYLDTYSVAFYKNEIISWMTKGKEELKK